MFWVYRYKGFSFTAARTVHTALVLAGQQGCSQADTGHLLLALVQTAQGTAADFLRRKRVTSTALAEHTAAHAAGRPRRLHSRDLAPELSKAMEFAVLGAHAASAARAENEHLLCAILEDSSCTPAGGWRLWASSCRRPRGNAASFPVSLCCPPSRGWLPPARAAPAINMAAT